MGAAAAQCEGGDAEDGAAEDEEGGFGDEAEAEDVA